MVWRATDKEMRKRVFTLFFRRLAFAANSGSRECDRSVFVLDWLPLGAEAKWPGVGSYQSA